MVPFEIMRISVIIPCLNEGEYIAKTLRQVNSLSGNFEVIVVDGGSSDKTYQIAAEFEQVKIFSSPKGRSFQMNKGAEKATGEILLFLHADTFLPENAYNLISTSMCEKGAVAGSFKLRLDQRHWLMNFYCWLSKFNLSFFTYGDHGIFIRKSIFEKIKGYKEIPFMEDVEILKRIKKEGRFKKLNSAVISSSRRFKKIGFFKQVLWDLVLVFLYKSGVSPVKLKMFYKDHQ